MPKATHSVWPSAYDLTARSRARRPTAAFARQTQSRIETQMRVGFGTPLPARQPDAISAGQSQGLTLQRGVLIFVTMILALLVLRTTVAQADSPPEAPVEIVARSGDTIWSLARRVQPEGDVRDLVSRITHENKLRGALRVGQVITVRP